MDFVNIIKSGDSSKIDIVLEEFIAKVNLILSIVELIV